MARAPDLARGQKAGARLILARKLLNLYRQKGAGAAFRTVKRFVRTGQAESPLTVRESLGFASEPVSYASREKPVPGLRYEPKRVNFVIPSFGRKSGGHTTLFRFARLLEQAGLDVEFYVFGQTEYLSEREIKRVVDESYFPLRARFRLRTEEMRPADLAVATEWRTAYAVRDFPHCRERLYFVQDYEPAFFPASSKATLAELTYGFGFECITAGRWLKGLMEEKGSRATSFDLAVDSEHYRAPEGWEGSPPKRVVFYARHNTPRRGFELGVLALELARRKHPDLEVVLYGWEEFDDRVGFPYVNGGLLDHAGLSRLYRGARAGLSLSLTNYSLVPQEMLACGLPVVEANLPSVRAAYPTASAGITLADPEPRAIAEALDRLLSEGETAHRARRESAAKLVSGLSWEASMAAAVERVKGL